MRQTESFLRGTPAKEQRSHGRGLTDAGGGDGAGDVGHCVVDGETGGDGATRGIYVEVDGLFRGVGFEK